MSNIKEATPLSDSGLKPLVKTNASLYRYGCVQGHYEFTKRTWGELHFYRGQDCDFSGCKCVHYKSKENTRKHHTQESQEVSHFQASGHKDARNSVIKTNMKHK